MSILTKVAALAADAIRQGYSRAELVVVMNPACRVMATQEAAICIDGKEDGVRIEKLLGMRVITDQEVDGVVIGRCVKKGGTTFIYYVTPEETPPEEPPKDEVTRAVEAFRACGLVINWGSPYGKDKEWRRAFILNHRGVTLGRYTLHKGRPYGMKWYWNPDKYHPAPELNESDRIIAAFSLYLDKGVVLDPQTWERVVVRCNRYREADIASKKAFRIENGIRGKRAIQGRSARSFVQQVIEEILNENV